jgi:hypothetical protein
VIYGSLVSKFSGAGHRALICKACQAKPKAEIDAIQQAEEIYGFLRQSHISVKNLDRLHALTSSPDQRVADWANITLEVALIKPYKRKRLGFLAAAHPELLKKLEESGLILAHGD